MHGSDRRRKLVSHSTKSHNVRTCTSSTVRGIIASCALPTVPSGNSTGRFTDPRWVQCTQVRTLGARLRTHSLTGPKKSARKLAGSCCCDGDCCSPPSLLPLLLLLLLLLLTRMMTGSCRSINAISSPRLGKCCTTRAVHVYFAFSESAACVYVCTYVCVVVAW